jgi:hypothetical protein
VGSFKDLLLKNQRTRRAHIYMKDFWCTVDSVSLKSWSPGEGRSTIRKTIFIYVYIEKNFLLQNQNANFNQTWYKLSLGKGNSKLFKLRARCSSKGRLKKCKNGVGSFKNRLLKNHRTRKAHIYMKAFWYNVNSSLLKSLSPGVRRGHNKENHIYMCLYCEKSSSPEPASQFQSNLVQIILGSWEF